MNTKTPPGDGLVGVAASLAAVAGYVAFGHLWPALLFGGCGAAAGGALLMAGRALARHVYAPLRRGLSGAPRRSNASTCDRSGEGATAP